MKKKNTPNKNDLIIPGNTPGLFFEQSTDDNKNVENSKNSKQKRERIVKAPNAKAFGVIIGSVLAVLVFVVIFMISVLTQRADPVQASINTFSSFLSDSEIFAVLESFERSGGELEFSLSSGGQNGDRISGTYSEDSDTGLLVLDSLYKDNPINVSAVFGKDKLALLLPSNADDELWIGISTKKFSEEIASSPFAYGSDSSNALSYDDEQLLKKFFSNYYDGIEREKAPDHVKKALDGPVKAISKFLADHDQSKDSSPTLLSGVKVGTVAYTYELSSSDICAFWELMIDEYYSDEEFARFVDDVTDGFISRMESYIKNARRKDISIKLTLHVYKDKLVCLEYELTKKYTNYFASTPTTNSPTKEKTTVRIAFDKNPSLRTGFDLSKTVFLLNADDQVISSSSENISAGTLDDTSTQFSWYLYHDSKSVKTQNTELRFTLDKETEHYTLSVSENGTTTLSSEGSLYIEDDILELGIDSFYCSGLFGGETYSGHIKLSASKRVSIKFPKYENIFDMDEEEIQKYVEEIEDIASGNVRYDYDASLPEGPVDTLDPSLFDDGCVVTPDKYTYIVKPDEENVPKD